MAQTLSKVSILIICTKDRPNELERILENLENCEVAPHTVLVVDSSSNVESKKVVKIHQKSGIKFIHIDSEPGLPHQRNIGVRFIHDNKLADEKSIIHFLDDDVEITMNYFTLAENILECDPKLSFLAAFNKLDTKQSIVLRLSKVLLHRDFSGKILRNGHAYPPINVTVSKFVEFVAGHSFSIRWPQVGLGMFNDEIRMYGEDLDFQVSLGIKKRWLVSPEFYVFHKKTKTNRYGARSEAKFTDAFRFRLVRQHPHHFKFLWFVVTLLAEIAFELSKAIFFRGDAAARFLGHLDFVIEVARTGKASEQLR